MIGQTISHYKITEKIGEGGMGEVYRVEDTTLKREIAIKVLAEEFTQGQERLARFEREAQLLASLNHPNIAAMHSFEHSDGVHFLVMELEDPEHRHQGAAGRSRRHHLESRAAPHPRPLSNASPSTYSARPEV